MYAKLILDIETAPYFPFFTMFRQANFLPTHKFFRSWDGIMREGTGFVLTQSLATAAAAVSMSCTFELHTKSHDRRILGRTSVPISPASQEHLLHEERERKPSFTCTVQYCVLYITERTERLWTGCSRQTMAGKEEDPRVSLLKSRIETIMVKKIYIFIFSKVRDKPIYFFARISPRRALASRTCSPSTPTPPRWRR